jgi:hypothetical protein
VAGLFDLSLRSNSSPGVSTRASAVAEAWAARSSAGAAVQLSAGAAVYENRSVMQCPPGVWATLAFVVDAALGALRVLGACDSDLGSLDMLFPLDTLRLADALARPLQLRLVLGMYDVQGADANALSAWPQRGDDLAALAVYELPLSGQNLSAVMGRASVAEQALHTPLFCAGAQADAAECEECSTCVADQGEAAGVPADF